ncbi:MAG: hypothetical protein GF372_12915 [Candidatus Marinimicrobia bacterium]|nr:hypothetical protein [Candidatus Neomarinimicrobiota bacterium]
MDININRIGYQSRIGNVLKTKRVKKQEREESDKEKKRFADQLDIAQLKKDGDDENPEKEAQAKDQKRLTAGKSGKDQKALPPKEEDEDQDDDLGINIDIKV